MLLENTKIYGTLSCQICGAEGIEPGLTQTGVVHKIRSSHHKKGQRRRARCPICSFSLSLSLATWKLETPDSRTPVESPAALQVLGRVKESAIIARINTDGAVVTPAIQAGQLRSAAR